MKSVNEIRDMIQTSRWNNDPASVCYLLDIVVALLDHIEVLNSRTEIKPPVVPAFDPAIHNIARCREIVPNVGTHEDIFCNKPLGHEGSHSGKKFESCGWVMIPGEKCTRERDHEGAHGNETTVQPQQPEFDAAAGRFWTPPEPLRTNYTLKEFFHDVITKPAWKEHRIKDLAAAIHGYVAVKGAEPILEGDDLDIVGGWIAELKTLWESM